MAVFAFAFSGNLAELAPQNLYRSAQTGRADINALLRGGTADGSFARWDALTCR